MSVRQYIGARYVPRFSDVNNGNWSNVFSYEPLTIVKNGNDYYTSKQSVPVGIAITNTDYWVKTGDYNGAISALDTRLTTAEGNIEQLNTANTQNRAAIDVLSLRNRVFGFIGDSFSDPRVGYGSWVENLATKLNSPIYNKATSGDGFRGVNATTFTTQLESLYQDHPECTDIILFGGNNDQSFITDYNGFIPYVKAFYAKFADRFPNASLHVFIANIPTAAPSLLSSFALQNYESARTYHVNAHFYNYVNCWQIAHAGYVDDSNLHPSNSMKYFYETYFYNCLNGADGSYRSIIYGAPANGVTLANNYASDFIVSNDKIITPYMVLTCTQTASGTNTLFTFPKQHNKFMRNYLNVIANGEMIQGEINFSYGTLVLYGLNTIPSAASYSILIPSQVIAIPW